MVLGAEGRFTPQDVEDFKQYVETGQLLPAEERSQGFNALLMLADKWARYERKYGFGENRPLGAVVLKGAQAWLGKQALQTGAKFHQCGSRAHF
jgi:hypothetical protein